MAADSLYYYLAWSSDQPDLKMKRPLAFALRVADSEKRRPLLVEDYL